jgi:periplasmic copper chaperone A
MRPLVLVAPIALTLLSACSGKPAAPESGETAKASDAAAPTTIGTAIADARVQLPIVPGRPGVAYFTLTPAPGVSGRLTGASIDHVGRAEMHESRMEGGTMTMAEVKTIAITPGQPVTFAPGGYHVMLFDIDAALKAGATTTLTATLDNGTKVTAQAKVTAPGGGDMGGMKM